MAALLVTLAVMSVAMTVALPAWRQQVQREREEELIFRGRQYVRAVQLFQRRYAAAYAPDVDTLVRLKFLRQKYADPMVDDGEFEILYQGSSITFTQQAQAAARPVGEGPAAGGVGQAPTTFAVRSGTAVVQDSRPVASAGVRGGVIGVRSRSTDTSIRTYNGATRYNEWLFVFVPRAAGPGGGRGMGPGGGRGGMEPGGRGTQPGGRGMEPGGRGTQPGGRGGQGSAQTPPQRGGRSQF